MDERGFEPPASSLPMRFVTLKTNHLQRKYLSISDRLGQGGTVLVYLVTLTDTKTDTGQKAANV